MIIGGNKILIIIFLYKLNINKLMFILNGNIFNIYALFNVLLCNLKNFILDEICQTLA